MAVIIPAPPIVPGYAYAIQIEVAGDDEIFPASCRLLAELRRFTYSPLLARLTTDNGGLARIDDNTIEVRLTAAQTEQIEGSSVMLDFVRTDVDPDAYQYVQIRLPVMNAVTRPAA
ncbi:hypothetical protein LUX29_20495 [Aureimonas altamirensis]|uniref:hypothetical protein n=1 Tax=Aureimonas altamirensis TaxID=370622 RepID=UPI001E50AF5B|nr:hypothetical protein [Aureimonas altamirensis]UHD45342.1 hypothetical protein LUX29_20495 [Aureimonas altamirensis]